MHAIRTSQLGRSVSRPSQTTNAPIRRIGSSL
jgi:hypothetical protein